MNHKMTLQVAATLVTGIAACVHAAQARLAEDEAPANSKACHSIVAERALELLRDRAVPDPVAIVCSLHFGAHPIPSARPIRDVAPDQICRILADSRMCEPRMGSAFALARNALATLIMPGPVSTQTTSDAADTVMPTSEIVRS